MKVFYTLTILSICSLLSAQTPGNLKGQLQNTDGEAVMYANVALYTTTDSSLAKVETSDETGIFNLKNISPGNYYLVASYVGLKELKKDGIQVKPDQNIDLGKLVFPSTDVELEGVSIVTQRSMVEVKPDRTVFNVEGTINSVGTDALSLLRKAPGVTVDNQNNINVLGRSGVLLYVDGKPLPLTGDDLTNYLESLPAEQLDRIDIITNPGAKYEAEGNAGILDLRLKKDKSIGANGSVSGTYSQGRYDRYNLNSSANYRNKVFNIFATAGVGEQTSFHDMVWENYQNGLFLDETNESTNEQFNYNYRVGMDFFVAKNHTIGFLVGGSERFEDRNSLNRIAIAPQDMPNDVDSLLVAYNTEDNQRSQNTYNLNYVFNNGKGRTINIDLDYGDYRNESERLQPNQYYDANEETLLTEIINSFDTPSDIDIYTAKIDYEDKLLGGTFGIGSRLSRVVSDNTFLFFDVINGEPIRNDRRSNIFEYRENVYAGYISYTRKIGEKLNISAGLRAEQTDASGDLQAFLPELQEPPVDLNYLNWFPSAGVTYQVAPRHSLALNYGRRINRPDYNVLNPFFNQLSELSFRKGNPRLNPEIVNNVELGYTFDYRYNFKIGYSLTTDQITRLIAPDENDPRAGFLTWDNLAEQTIISFNASAPIQVNKWWNAFINFSASHIDNQADYGDGAVVDVQAFTYNIYQQHTFNLPAKFNAEVSGYFSGPGVWGGVFEYESNWGLDIGLQRRFLQDQLNVKISASDLFYQNGWDGFSEFAGLFSTGSGRWDSRRVTLSVSYQFGNQNIKSRKRKTGLEGEADRVGG